MPWEQLLDIKPYWAFGRAADNALNDSLFAGDDIYSICSVCPAELIATAELYEVKTDKLFNDEPLNDSRVAGILYQWDTGKFVDPPIVVIPDSTRNKLVFVDGRHRTKVAFLLRYPSMPIAILTSEFHQISRMIGLEK
jgi:hypothetical protein